MSLNKMSLGKWDIYWTGWKESQYTTEIAGQWIAHNKSTGINYMVSYPGYHGAFNPGDQFNTSVRPDQVILEITSARKLKMACKRKAFKELLEAIKPKTVEEQLEWTKSEKKDEKI